MQRPTLPARFSWLKVMAALVFCAGVGLLAQGLYIPLKAQVAQWLLDSAWQRASSDGRPSSPWPWADAYPVARLQWQAGQIDQIVLSNASARGMAFGPGHVGGSARPGEPGHVVLSAHRDTHFSFLGRLKPGHILTLEYHGGLQQYEVYAREIIDVRFQQLDLAPETGDLTLVTCWPLDAWRSGGPQRLLVHLRHLDRSAEVSARLTSL